MGEGKETNTRESPVVEVQERGEIFFFYRPKVSKDSAHNLDDVQRTYIVLRPESGEKKVEEKQSSESGKEADFKRRRKSESGEEEDENAEDGEGSEDSKEESAGGPEDEGKLKESDDSKEKSRGNAEDEDEGKYETADDDTPTKEENAEHGDKESGGKGRKRKLDKDDEERGEGRVAGKGTEKVELSKTTLLRLIVMGRKSLPDPSKRSRPYWGFVELVTTNVDDIKKALAEEKYETKTRGMREKPVCRPVGEGIYRIVRHNNGKKVDTHLVYKLELPGAEEEHEPQEALNIEPEASFLIQIKNPEQGNPRTQGLQNKQKATFPAHLQEHLGSYNFAAADPPDFLNYEGCEFILISASDNIEEELGLELEAENVGDRSRSDLLSLFDHLGNETKAPIKPLIDGKWA